jgi:tetratricopeptide (TPR) repeat protein
MRSLPIALSALIAAGALASTGYASTKVYGSGLASSCSKLAIAGFSDRRTLDTCNLAIEQEAMGRENAAKTHVNRGVILLRRANLDSAAADFGRAERLMPSLPEIYINRGVVLIKQKRWAEAVAQLDKGISLNPDELEKAYFNRALAREQVDDVRGAYLDFRKASELAPEWDAPKKELMRYTVRRAT